MAAAFLVNVFKMQIFTESIGSLQEDIHLMCVWISKKY